MSTEDTSNLDEAAFDAFLRGEEALSQRLKSLPQPQSPAALDAAVLARIEAAMANELQQKNAANDAVGPAGANARRPRLNAFWNVPIGLAAGVVLTLLARMYMQTAQMPALTAQASLPERAAAAEKKPADAVVALAGPPPAPMEAPVPPPAMPLPRMQVETRSAPMMAATADAAPPPPVVAAAPAAAPAPVMEAQKVAQAETVQEVRVEGHRASLSASLPSKRRADAEVEIVAAEDVGKMPDKNVADSLQRVPGVAMPGNDERKETALEVKRNAGSNIEVVNNSRDAPTALAKSKQEAFAAKDKGLAEGAVAGNAAPQARQAEEADKPKAWLALIDAKINAGLPQQALDEWAKFHKAYPAYAVPEVLVEKIKTLQTQQK